MRPASSPAAERSGLVRSVHDAVEPQVRRGRRWAGRRRAAATRAVQRVRRPRVHSACYAAHSALYFRPDGRVQVCCATGFEVGTVTGQDRMSLRELWDGEGVAEHRRRLEADRFDLGCQECEVAIETGGRSSSLASNFDRWRLKAPYEFPHLLDFALSSRCNLQCVMCNGELSSSIRTQREGRAPMPPAYDEAFFEQLAEFLPHATRLQFKGGEPFLAPENRRVWDLLIEQGSTAEVLIITNGTIWSPDVERYVRRLRAEISVSVDGTSAEVFEPIRVGAGFEKVWANIDRFQALGVEIGRPITLSFCFMTGSWHQLPDFLLQVQDRGVRCYVILVNQPDEHDVLKLPTDQVAEILAELEARDPHLTHPRARQEYARVLDRLRTHLADPVAWSVQVVAPAPVPVEIARPHPQPRPAAPAAPAAPHPYVVDIDRVRADLRARSGAEPVDVLTHAGVIVEASGPAWAGSLELPRWIGRRAREVPGLLEELGGTTPSVTVGDGPIDPVSETVVAWAGGGALPDLLVWVLRMPVAPDGLDHEPVPPEHWLIVPTSAHPR